MEMDQDNMRQVSAINCRWSVRATLLDASPRASSPILLFLLGQVIFSTLIFGLRTILIHLLQISSFCASMFFHILNSSSYCCKYSLVPRRTSVHHMPAWQTAWFASRIIGRGYRLVSKYGRTKGTASHAEILIPHLYVHGREHHGLMSLRYRSVVRITSTVMLRAMDH